MADLLKLRDLCNVLGINLLRLLQDEVDGSITDVDSLLASDLSVKTTDLLNISLERLSKLKSERFSELKKKALAVLSFWDTLMVPFEKKEELICLVYYTQVESDNEITEVSSLSLEFFNKVVEEYDKLHEQMSAMIFEMKSKLQQILKATHLLSNFVDKDEGDPIAAFLDMKEQISNAQNIASQRAGIVAKIEFLQHAAKEIDWYKESDTLQDERSVKVRIARRAR